VTYLGKFGLRCKTLHPKSPLPHNNSCFQKNIDINSQILYMDPNTDLDAGPHTDPNLGIQDIIMSHFANLICFET
jgi:hypothetical protein